MKKFINALFFGNIFYGFCTVALSIESNLQHRISLNSTRLYVLLFLATIVYYSRIYYRSSSVINVDERTQWYRDNRPAVKAFLVLATTVIIADVLLIVFINLQLLINLAVYYWVLIGIVPLLGVMYSFRLFPVKKLRGVGWLKPFVIGFVWAGVVTIFPVFFWQLRNAGATPPGLAVKTLLWLQNFLFISTLAIAFDIKDYHSDKKHKLNTYPATFGIKNTVFFIIVPLTLISFAVLVFFHWKSNFPLSHTLIQSVPYLILLGMSKSFMMDRKLLFYLAAVDGLMLLKAIAGIISIVFFN